jgi:hypothetical protein
MRASLLASYTSVPSGSASVSAVVIAPTIAFA